MKPNFLPILLIVCSLIACNYSIQPDNITDNMKAGNICTSISASKIRQALAQSQDRYILLNIYPVKKSNSKSESDLELVVLFQDKRGNPVNFSKGDIPVNFEQSLSNYVGYLQSKKIKASTVPYGYFIRVDSLYPANAAALSICVEPRKSMMWYCNKVTDSSGKCPPDCCVDELKVFSNSDSTGKCPPCDLNELLYASSMKQIITTIYQKQNIK